MFNLIGKNSARIFFLFLSGWFILNLLQAAFTDLNNDEAYYWMYSMYPDWGYYDHPPMVAMMIGAGYFLTGNELGVRLFTVIFSVLSLAGIWLMIPDEQRRVNGSSYFFLLAFIIPVFNIFGFIATPDSPLLFFSVFFLLAYKRFSSQDNWINTLLTGILMAAMMYSKYHAALLILFVILSDLRILLRPRFYVASVLALILFMPHIVWQFANDFPSFRYHLVERASGLHPGNIPEYLGNLMVIQNPVMLVLTIWLTIKVKAADRFDRTLRFVFYGFLFFFLLSALRYKVQPQWTSLMAIPSIIILFRALGFRRVIPSAIKWTAVILIPLILFIRAALIFDIIPLKYLKEEFHEYSRKMMELSELAGERPVVFTNSYQDPSVYTFYTGKFAHSLNNLNYRRSQYDIWDFEERINGKEVVYVPHWPTDYISKNFSRHYFFDGDSVFYKEYDDFMSLQKEFIILESSTYTFNRDTINQLDLKLYNPYPYSIDLMKPEFPVAFYLNFFTSGIREERWPLSFEKPVQKLMPGDTVVVKASFRPVGMKESSYDIAVCCEAGPLYDTFNSNFSSAILLK